MSTGAFFASAWHWNTWITFACGALAGAYFTAEGFRDWRRALLWVLGVLLILLAFVSPFGVLADGYLFSGHMARHILLLLIVPALLLCARPGGLATRRRFGNLPHKPWVAWIMGIGTMAFWHVPAVFHIAMRTPVLHIVEPISLLIAGTLYWWPVLGPAPVRLPAVPDAAAYLFASCLACTVMGIFITFAPPVYGGYAHSHDAYGILPLIREQWGISPAVDQQIGGLLMWVPCCLIYLTAIMAMFARWYGEEHRASAEA
ncbi:MAG: cytochrome c oxidase assembly protein [Bryobacterales bacterium]|nr:cytochrome c oxidase assembly protein [Bryobacterales bacterium]MBV9399725.1 cytochrome c oxidase assembly protein [Bryobacterales bacterium]